MSFPPRRSRSAILMGFYIVAYPDSICNINFCKISVPRIPSANFSMIIHINSPLHFYLTPSLHIKNSRPDFSERLCNVCYFIKIFADYFPWLLPFFRVTEKNLFNSLNFCLINPPTASSSGSAVILISLDISILFAFPITLFIRNYTNISTHSFPFRFMFFPPCGEVRVFRGKGGFDRCNETSCHIVGLKQVYQSVFLC